MDTSIPAIQTFQFEAGSIGDLSKSVNLFRGDVNHPQTLLKLPDRPGRSELAVSLAIIYQSNVQDIVTQRNLEAPTGVLGVGWDLPLDRIVLDPGGTGSSATRQYYLQNGETSTKLIRQGTAYQQPRFITTAITQQDLSNSQISANLQQVFANNSIALTRSGSVSPNQNGTWTLTDTGNERLFVLTANGSEVTVYDGGESYQPQNYQFWRITYYPVFERWEIMKENGVCFVYGGGVQTTSQGYQTSRGNSVQWNVRWGNWLGNSSAIEGQQQYASAWYLNQLCNRWGDAVSYQYNGWNRDAATGLIPDVEQLVGYGQTTGKPFTKAVYLTQMTDIFGRTITFNYADKVYSDPTTNPTGAREYQDPHQPIANNTTFNSFQDAIETKYLITITAQSATGKLLFTIHFTYTNTLINVTQNTGQLYGDTCKRYLQSITQTTADGDSEPGLRFDYYTQNGDINAGALKSITYPSGGIATYSYTEKSLAICNRQQTVAAPDTSGNWVPRVFFGSDYTVTLWYNNVVGQLAMTVYTWIGRWQGWQPTGGVIYNNVLGLEIDTLQVLTQENHFVLFFPAYADAGDSSQYTFAYLYHKDPREMGQWIPLENEGKGAIAFDTSGAPVSLAAGETFIAAMQFQDSNNSYTVSRYTWDWTIRNWRVEPNVASGTASGVEITAGQEYYVTLAYTLHQPQTQVQISWIDSLGNWHQSASLADNLEVSYPEQIYLTPDRSMVAVGNLVQQSSTYPQYMLAIYQWDDQYALKKTYQQTFTQQVQPGGAPASIVPTLTNNCLVFCGENAVRFDGVGWQLNQNLEIHNPPAASQDAWYATGEDYVIQTIPSVSVYVPPSCKLLTYDPDSDTESWSQKSLVQPQPPIQYRSTDSDTANYPTASDSGYFTSDKYLYARGQTPNWNGGIQQPLFTMPDNLDTKAIINECPNFIAYSVPNENLAQSVTQVLILRNGEVIGTETLTGQKYWTLDEQTSGLGRYPAGLAAFITYDATLRVFDDAQSYTLYRFAGDSISQNLVHYPVAAISVTDGFGALQQSAYDFDASTAACDPSGRVVKYYKSTTYMGCADPSTSQNGRTETYYINGFQGGSSSPYLYVLDGMIEQVLTYDNQNTLVASNQQTWTVYTSRNSNPLVQDATPLAINGTYTKLTSQQTVKDGVATLAVHEYTPTGFPAPYSGQEVQTATTVFNTNATPETHYTSKQYGYEIYPNLASQHLLTAVVQTTQSVSVNGATPVPTAAKATTYDFWTGVIAGETVQIMDVSGQYHWRGGATVAFSFNASPDPTLWLRKTSVVSRTAHGLVAETQDALNVSQSMLYDTNQEFLIAHFGNTSLSGNEGTYYGFEPYMLLQTWTVGGTASVLTGDAHTGSTSLQLPACGGGTLSAHLTPARQSTSFMLGWWYKTSANFQGNAQSGWNITLTSAGTPVDNPISVTFSNTQGTWKYACQVIDVSSYQGSSPLTIQVVASNTSASPVLLDDVSILPFPGTLVAYTYDADHSLVLTETHLGGNTLRHLYDRFQRKQGTVGPAEQVTALSVQYTSRTGNGDQFNSQDPNLLIQLKARNGGSCEQFQTGDEWQTRWSPTGNWQSTAGGLINTGTATLELAATEFTQNFALLVELIPQAAVADTLGLQLGGGSVLEWQATTQQWLLTVAGQPVTALAQPGQVAHQWLLIGGDRSLLFYVNGQLVFSQIYQRAPVSSLQLFTGANQLSLRQLTLIKDPIVSVEYHDAAGRKRQTQVLLDDDSLVAQTIYDQRGKQIAITKQAPGSFGQGANVPLLAYRPNFVNTTDFLNRLDQDGIMQGDVADYYQGQVEPASGLPRSNDEDYPYTRIRFEASPLARKIERSLPGKVNAIIGTVPPDQRNTEKFQYDGGSASVIPGQSGDDTEQYFVETQTKPANNAANQPLTQTLVKDKANQVIVSATKMTSGVDDFLYSTTTTSYSSSGTQVEVLLPNYYSKLGSDQQSFISISTKNPLGQMVHYWETDTKLNRAIYDSSGRLRFSQTNQEALDSAERYIGYRKYDLLGRVIEAGTYPFDWNDATEASLQALADQSQWPPATTTVQTIISYDGDGSDPNAIGHLTQLRKMNARFIATKTFDTTVTETFTYNSNSQITNKTLNVSRTNGTSTSVEVAYAYDCQGNVTQITYPQGNITGIVQVYYGYDRQGRVISIGESPANLTTYAAYTYDAEGNRVAISLNQNIVQRTSNVASPRWFNTVTDKTASGFTAQSTYQYWPDGSIQEIEVSFAGSGGADRYINQYTYDALRRLLTAQNSVHPDWNVAVSQYDANGNLLSLQQGEQVEAFSYTPGTNQLADLQYNPFGQLQSTPMLQLDYEPNSGRTSQIHVTASGNTVMFGYTGQGQRVLKQVLDPSLATVSSKLYVHGTHDLPLLEIQEDGSAIAYIYGPGGLVAMQSNALYFMLKDHEGSIRQVFDTTGNLVAGYDYLPFGGLARSYGSQPGIMSYLYTGQELDPETNLYNYRARLYDSALRRFYAPDPKRQFASSYVYVGDDPTMMIDPTGMFSFSDFLSDFAHFFADAALTIAGIAVMAVGTVFGSGPLATVLGSTLLGAGISGFTYDIKTLASGQTLNSNASWKNWAIQVGIGAAAGLIAGGFAGVAGKLVEVGAEAGYAAFEIGGAARIAVNAGLGGVGGNAAAGAVGQVFNNLATHTSVASGVGITALLGGVLGGAAGGASEGAARYLSGIKAPWSDDDLAAFFNSSSAEERAPLLSKWQATGFQRVLEATTRNNVLVSLPGDLFSGLGAGLGVIPTLPSW